MPWVPVTVPDLFTVCLGRLIDKIIIFFLKNGDAKVQGTNIVKRMKSNNRTYMGKLLILWYMGTNGERNFDDGDGERGIGILNGEMENFNGEYGVFQVSSKYLQTVLWLW